MQENVMNCRTLNIILVEKASCKEYRINKMYVKVKKHVNKIHCSCIKKENSLKSKIQTFNSKAMEAPEWERDGAQRKI
jgi:hypothetical protein